MKVLDIAFTTIRASVASVAEEIKKTTADTRIIFGPGFVPPPHPLAATATLVNPQTLADIQQAWGSEGLEHATE